MQSSEQHFIIVITFRLNYHSDYTNTFGLKLMEIATKTKTKIQEF